MISLKMPDNEVGFYRASTLLCAVISPVCLSVCQSHCSVISTKNRPMMMWL